VKEAVGRSTSKKDYRGIFFLGVEMNQKANFGLQLSKTFETLFHFVKEVR